MAADRETVAQLREPPWSAESEQGLLGALFLDSDAFGRISDRGLEAAHFFDHRHRAIWAAVAGMVASHEPARKNAPAAWRT